MNVLLLSVSAKIPLVNAFRDALGPEGGSVFGADLNPRSPGLRHCDAFVPLPESDSPSFAPTLLHAVKAHGIRLVVPTRDGELRALADIAAELAEAGACAVVAGTEALDICRDKVRFNSFCEGLGLTVPRTYRVKEDAGEGPFFVRPRHGAGGKDARLAGLALITDPDFEWDRYIVQDFIDLPEYSIDVLLDLEGRPLQAVSRRRLVVRNGESVATRVEMDDRLCSEALHLAESIGLTAHAVLQAFYIAGESPIWIEANPRFGGASALSIRAGLESPRRLIQMALGRTSEAAAARPITNGLLLQRNGGDVFLRPEEQV